MVRRPFSHPLVLLGALFSAYACNVYTEELLAGNAGAGNSETGGEETGGEETGGAATGGVATGGAATGGEATGGEATGGEATGGTGGGGTGGVPGGAGPTGGVGATGGVAGGTGGAAGSSAAAGVEPGGAGGEGGGEPVGGFGGEPTGGTGGVATGGELTGGVPTGGAGVCGDGTVNPGNDETCDDAGESATCDDDCTAVECGDTVVNTTAGEECEPTLASDCRDEDCTYSYLHYLVNRYAFDGSGTGVVDYVGDGDGTIVGAQLTGTGRLELAGGTSGQYASLLNGLASSLTNATFEAWVNWSGGDNWQRIFDFGSSDAGEFNQGMGVTYLFLTPKSLADVMQACFSTNGQDAEVCAFAAAPLATGVDSHVAVVVDDDSDTLTLYLNGAVEDSVPFTESLSGLDDVNNWFGWSQFSGDPGFGGSIDEFRIYGVALTAAEVMESYLAGPNP